MSSDTAHRSSDPARRGRRPAAVTAASAGLAALAGLLAFGLAAAGPAAADTSPRPATTTTACPQTSTPKPTPKAGATTSHVPSNTITVAKEFSSKVSSSGKNGKTKSASPSPCPGTSTGGGGHGWLVPGAIAAGLLVLCTALGTAIRRSGRTSRPPAHTPAAVPYAHRASAGPATRRPPAPTPAPATAEAPVPPPRRTAAPAPRPPGLRPATVSTHLHPQGYVTVDDCLYRATWAEPGELPPGPGESVAVAHPDPHDDSRDPGVLLAFPADPPASGRHHAR